MQAERKEIFRPAKNNSIEKLVIVTSEDDFVVHLSRLTGNLTSGGRKAQSLVMNNDKRYKWTMIFLSLIKF
ncbi:hypothetical protein AKA01nite_06370 [Alkalibacterium kapii]|uniref:Uncharacterized protein n=1 Tax=Alkalibacterium kapii TaxID=426704 RepID=A0A511AS45_9LACT|nr:hypothetical protein AKA01nite_06370 [Alkalibacterium kapii]